MTRRRETLYVVLGFLAATLVAARAALPSVVRRQIENRINGLKNYRCQVRDVDLSLLRGAVRVKGVRVYKKDQPGDPFFSAPAIDVNVTLKELLKHRVIARVHVDRPVVSWVNRPAADETLPKATPSPGEKPLPDPKKARAKGWPMTVEVFTVKDGQIRYREGSAEPPADFILDQIELQAGNVTNSPAAESELHGTARALGSGKATLEIRAKPLMKAPTFDLDLALRDLPVEKLNPILRGKAKIDAKSGRLDVVVEAAAADGRIKGYAKPLLRDLEVGVKEGAKGILQRAWGHVASVGVKLLKNKPNDLFAARISFEGPVPDAKADVWATVASVLHNGFVQALSPRFEGSVSLDELRAAPGPVRPGEPFRAPASKKKD